MENYDEVNPVACVGAGMLVMMLTAFPPVVPFGVSLGVGIVTTISAFAADIIAVKMSKKNLTIHQATHRKRLEITKTNTQ